MLVVFLLALGLILSLFNSSLIFEKTRRKNFKCLGEWPLPPLVKSSSFLSPSCSPSWREFIHEFWIPADPACWPGRKNFASLDLDRVCAVLASVLRLDSPQEPAKRQNGAAAADHAPTPKLATEPPNTKRKTQELSGTVQDSLSAYSSSRKRKRSNLKRARTSEVR